MTQLNTSVDHSAEAPSKAPTRRRFAGTGFVSALVGSVCCVGGAVAVATGVGALSFFQVWMNKYQIYFILASLALMALAAVRMTRKYGLRHAKQMLIRHAAVMVVVYVVTFGIAAMAYGIIAG